MMKTRQEMVYEFMLSIAGSYEYAIDAATALTVRHQAEALADEYLKYISGN